MKTSQVVFETVHAQAVVPQREKDGDVGYDLTSCETLTVEPGGRALVGTGLKCRVYPADRLVKAGLELHPQIRPRSGNAWKHGIHVGAGEIDIGYRGELKVVIMNLGKEAWEIKAGETKIAQLKFVAVGLPEVVEGPVTDCTERGVNGFGSTDRPTKKLRESDD